jgi:hypothetical protein
MIRDAILTGLAETGGATISRLLQHADVAADTESAAAMEMLLCYSSEVVFDAGKWKLAQTGRSASILAEIENYSVSTGRKIFRLSSALARLPAHEHPNEDELKQALGISHAKYELLPNAMIKRNY